MKIVVTGGTGLIGHALVQRLLARGDDVVVLTRNPARVAAGRGVAWNAKSVGPWTTELADADAVVNLAGENIGQRWTEARKRSIMDSRLCSTHAIVDGLKQAPPRQRTLVSTSAVGFYGSAHGDEVLDETSPAGEDFLARLTGKWESAARSAEPAVRVVIFRFGVVLSTEGGALPKMMLPFQFFAGGRVGSGRQWMSWIDLEDVLRAIEWALDSPAVRGAYNITSPEPATNRAFAAALGRVMHRPAFMPAPAFALSFLYGEMAEETILGGQRVTPARALREGFQFRFPELEQSLRHVTSA